MPFISKFEIGRMALVFPNTIQSVKNFDRRITTTQTSIINTFVSLFFEKFEFL